MKKRELLIEKWLPIDIISAESMRERGASSALPPLYFLHIWWARRPLLTSRVAILASLLPAWNEKWPVQFKAKYPTDQAYQEWFLKACGIFGDPVAGRERIRKAKEARIKLKDSPYTHKRAFTITPNSKYLEEINTLIQFTWGDKTPTIADFFSGGGSIPFEALRYGYKTVANELNPVASVILKSTLEYPFRYGDSLEKELKRYGKLICDAVNERLSPFFPKISGERIHAFIWARTVNCPYTGKPIPLTPNWWLSKGEKPVAVEAIFNAGKSEAFFRIVQGKDACAAIHPDEGTVSRGNAISPWAGNQPVDGSYIKEEAKAGRMKQQLYVVALKKTRGKEYRTPTQADLEAVKLAEEELVKKSPEWRLTGILPDDVIPFGNKTSEPLRSALYP